MDDREKIKAGLKAKLEAGTLDLEQLKRIADSGRYLRAGNEFSVPAFKDWFWCLYGLELPEHAGVWVEAMFREFEKPGDEIRGVLNKSFRGSIKSTVQIALALYLHGHFPVQSGLIVQARDADAKETAKFMSDAILSGAAWKQCFPNIVADESRGWSLAGYQIKDTRVPYEEWVNLTGADHGRNASFAAVSVEAGAIGRHPTLYLFLDDIHDQKNTASQAEMASVKKALMADVLPTMSRPGRKPFFGASYTPWLEDDAYADPLEKSNLFVKLNTPAFHFDPEGTDEWEGQKITLTWPKAYPVTVLKGWRDLLGKREFGRMYMCDLEVGKGQALRYSSDEEDAIGAAWPTIGGVDPVNIYRPANTDSRKQSSFGLGYVSKIPQGGAVVVDGVLKPCSQIEAENYIAMAQTMFPNWLFAAVENVGGGAVFIQAVRRNPNLKIVDSDLSGLIKKSGRIRSKRDRFLLEVAPWFENATVRISTRRSPYLDALRRLFDKFYELDENDPAWDAGDTVYHALKAMPDVLVINSFNNELPQVVKKQKQGSILAGMNTNRGYGNG